MEARIDDNGWLSITAFTEAERETVRQFMQANYQKPLILFGGSDGLGQTSMGLAPKIKAVRKKKQSESENLNQQRAHRVAATVTSR